MAARFAVELDIEDDKTRRDFAGVLTSMPDFRVLTPGGSESPDLVIMDIRRGYRDVLERAAAVRGQAPFAEIFVTALHIDADDLVKLFRSNIVDYVELPLKDQEFEQALERFVKRREQAKQLRPQKSGKLINLMGSKGGIGTTTVAVNLAVSLKKRDRSKSVVLVDLDLQFGDVALFLDLKPAHSIIHVARNRERLLHSEFMEGVLTEFGDEKTKIHVLPSAKPNEDLSQLHPETVCETIAALTTMFDYVVVDSGHVIHEITDEMLNRFSTLYLVSTLHLPVYRNTDRFLSYLAHHEDVRVIINRYRSKYEEISIGDFAKNYKEVYFTIPNDYSTASVFLNQAKPIPYMSRWGQLAKAYRRLAAQVISEKS